MSAAAGFETRSPPLQRGQASETLLSSVLQLNQSLVPRHQACEEKLAATRQEELKAKRERDSGNFLSAALRARILELETLVHHAAALLPTIGHVEKSAEEVSSTVAHDHERQTDQFGSSAHCDSSSDPCQTPEASPPVSEGRGAETRLRLWVIAMNANGGVDLKSRRVAQETRSSVDEPSDKSQYRDKGDEDEDGTLETLQVSLRIAERHVAALAEANRTMFQALMGALLARGPSGGGGNSNGRAERGLRSSDESEIAYARASDAGIFNQMMERKVGPGSRNEKRPLWLFKVSSLSGASGVLPASCRLSVRLPCIIASV